MIDLPYWQLLWQQGHLLRPWWLLALLPLALVVWLRWRLDEEDHWQAMLPAHLCAVLTLGDTGWRKNLPLKVLAGMMGLAIIAGAGPTWSREPSPFGEDRGALLILLDNSDSMLEQDLAPSRLARAKQKIRDLMALRQDGRTALVVFAGSAHTVMPLTHDGAVLIPFLAAIAPDMMPQAGKAPERALPLLQRLLVDEQAATVLLISDGVSPASGKALAGYFANSPHRLIVLAAGDPAVGGKRPLDLASLRSLASTAGGTLLTTRIDDGDVRAIHGEIERQFQLNGDTRMPWQDMGYYLLFPVVALLLLWFRKGWLVQWGLLICLAFPLLQVPAVQASAPPFSLSASLIEHEPQPLRQWWLDLWLTPDQQGQWYFRQKDYLSAAKHYADPFYKGVAYYYAAEYSLAQLAFLQAEGDLARLYTGNSLARQREYLAARTLFRQLATVSRDPEIRRRAQQNAQVMDGIVEEINRTSQSQTGTLDGPESSTELPDDRPQTADGAEETVVASLLAREVLDAEALLASSALTDRWLRRVEADPKAFLRAKFLLQLHAAPTEARGERGAPLTNKE